MDDRKQEEEGSVKAEAQADAKWLEEEAKLVTRCIT